MNNFLSKTALIVGRKGFALGPRLFKVYIHDLRPACKSKRRLLAMLRKELSK